MDKAGFEYEKRIAEENPELCAKYGITGAPTLVLPTGEKYYGVSEIKRVVKELSVKEA